MKPGEFRHLLEMAAKAHGGLLYVEDMDAWIHVDADGNRGDWWSPAVDDGDSRRLEVKLRIDVEFNHSSVYAHAHRPGIGWCEKASIMEDEDAGAATRLAVLRAAAAIGESMP